MPERLRTISGAVAGVLLTGCAGSGDITGQVRYIGPVPADTQMYVPNLNRTIDAHTLHVDSVTGGLRDVVVFLRPATPVADGAIVEMANDTEPPTINQIDEVFEPHVLAVRAGRPVRFISADAGNHNIHAVSFEHANTFNRFFSQGTVYHHTFTSTKDDRPVMLMCDLHSWMQAWLYVFDHPYHAVTDRRGSFAIRNVPPGRYTLVAHHADGRLTFSKPITMAAGRTQTLTLTLGKPEP